MSDTSAPLLAIHVAAACILTLHEIEQSRRATMASICVSKRGTAMYAEMSDAEIWEALPAHERDIPSNIRAAEYDRVKLVHELAVTIAEENDDLRIQVSLEDFQFIKRPYMKRRSH